MWEKCMKDDCELLFETHSRMVNHYRTIHLKMEKLYRGQ